MITRNFFSKGVVLLVTGLSVSYGAQAMSGSDCLFGEKSVIIYEKLFLEEFKKNISNLIKRKDELGCRIASLATIIAEAIETPMRNIEKDKVFGCWTKDTYRQMERELLYYCCDLESNNNLELSVDEQALTEIFLIFVEKISLESCVKRKVQSFLNVSKNNRSLEFKKQVGLYLLNKLMSCINKHLRLNEKYKQW